MTARERERAEQQLPELRAEKAHSIEIAQRERERERESSLMVYGLINLIDLI